MRNTQNKIYRFVEADLPVIWFQVPLKKDKITVYGGEPQESIICIANGRYIHHVGSPKRVLNPNHSHTTRGMMSTLSIKHHFYLNVPTSAMSRGYRKRYRTLVYRMSSSVRNRAASAARLISNVGVGNRSVARPDF